MVSDMVSIESAACEHQPNDQTSVLCSFVLSLPSTLLLRKGLRLTVAESGDGRGLGAAWVSE